MAKVGQVRMSRAPTKAEVSAAIGMDWQSVSFRHSKALLADTIDADAKTVNRAITGETLPELHKALASLLVDPTALQRTFALYGGRFVPDNANAANDMATISDLSGLVTAFVKVLEDGVRDHRETVALAGLIAPLMVQLSAIMDESRRIEGVAV